MGAEPPLRLVPEQARRGGADLAAAGEAIGGLRAGAGSQIEAASAGRPWGHDDIGAGFEQNYRRYEQQVLAAWGSVGSYLADLGGCVVSAVCESVATDQASVRRIRST
jgi:hypothetical protein